MAVAKLAVVVTVLAADHDANMRKCNYSCFWSTGGIFRHLYRLSWLLCYTGELFYRSLGLLSSEGGVSVKGIEIA